MWWQFGAFAGSVSVFVQRFQFVEGALVFFFGEGLLFDLPDGFAVLFHRRCHPQASVVVFGEQVFCQIFHVVAGIFCADASADGVVAQIYGFIGAVAVGIEGGVAEGAVFFVGIACFFGDVFAETRGDGGLPEGMAHGVGFGAATLPVFAVVQTQPPRQAHGIAGDVVAVVVAADGGGGDGVLGGEFEQLGFFLQCFFHMGATAAHERGDEGGGEVAAIHHIVSLQFNYLIFNDYGMMFSG